MRALAMRIRGILRGGDVEKLTGWLHDAERSALYGVAASFIRCTTISRRFAMRSPKPGATVRQNVRSSGEDAEAGDVRRRRRRLASRTNDPLSPIQNHTK
jgi:hypothetical protein